MREQRYIHHAGWRISSDFGIRIEYRNRCNDYIREI